MSNVVMSFEKLERILKRMLHATRSQQWDALEPLRHRYAQEEAQLKLHANEPPADDAERVQRSELLARIFELDSQVQGLATQRLAILDTALRSAGVALPKS
ncbi:flagellar protein FliT [Cupriavidus pampae]|nr:flagellar protein FliT [Cupriavidus pampae]